MIDAKEFFASKVFARRGYRPLVKVIAEYGTLQCIHTPFTLCGDILKQLAATVNLLESQIVVLFNLEFVDMLITDYQVPAKHICFICDSNAKERAARVWYGIKNIHRVSYTQRHHLKTSEKQLASGVNIVPKIKKQFDVVIMNPPYQPPVKPNEKNGGSGSRHILWDQFVHLSMDILKDGGHAAHIHPVKWRKPDDEMWDFLRQYKLLHLVLHTKKHGIQIFGASTPFDWYIIQKAAADGAVSIMDTDGCKVNLDLSCLPFLPNNAFDIVLPLIAKDGEPTCPVLYSRSAYGEDKPWMNKERTIKFKYPCIRSTGVKSDGLALSWSSRKKEFFGVSKVVFGEADVITNALIDMDGDYGITGQGIGIRVDSSSEAKNIKAALESDKFNKVLKSCRWSQFRIDWRMFKYFRKDFYTEFLK